MNTPTPHEPIHVCYWIIGAANKNQAPAVALDLHNELGELIGQTQTWRLPKTHFRRAARAKAMAYARKHGISSRYVAYDPDSTECFAQC